MPEELDRELLERFVQGDQEAFELLFRMFEADVYRWILRIVCDASAAEDVLVEAFWRAYRGRTRFDSSRSFGAWMRRIATNAACDHLGTSRHLRYLEKREWDAIEAPPVKDPTLHESITRAFHKLPATLQVVAMLALVDERPYAEIADALDLPIGTVKSRVFRAVVKLRRELERLGVRP